MGRDKVLDILNAFAHSQIIHKNPVFNSDDKTKQIYFNCLRKYIESTPYKNDRFVKEQFKIYSMILRVNNIKDYSSVNPNQLGDIKYLIPFDLVAILGYKRKFLSSLQMKFTIYKMLNDFELDISNQMINTMIHTMIGEKSSWNRILKYSKLKQYQKYLNFVMNNCKFARRRPFKIMITATMSAGKSSLINAIVGKNICKSQNLACTNKIHKIISKPYEDKFIYKSDYEIYLNANQYDILNDNSDNSSNDIIISTYFNSVLKEKRTIIYDSPGVNFSGNENHKILSQDMIEENDYDLLIYVMNATQLSTNDEYEHLKYVLKNINKKKIIFVINKIDLLDEDKENCNDIVNSQIKYLENIGFKNPVVMPISAIAAYLSKSLSDKKDLKRSDLTKIYALYDKLESLNLSSYYKKYFSDIKILENNDDEIKQLLKLSGLEYLEKYIAKRCN